MKFFYILALGLMMSLSAHAQDWVNDKPNLSYFSHEGEVFIQPDYSGMMVYFKEAPSLNVKTNLLKTMATKARINVSSIDKSIQLMEYKKLMKFESMEGLPAISTPAERTRFLQDFDLARQGAYDVLPKFEVNGQEIAFTKQVVVSLTDNHSAADISSILNKYDARFL
ncbi:MAG: hypothetical protein AAGA66_02685, partial [Bacteroidota bacterium]